MRTIMLTGDAPAAALAVGKALGLPEADVFAGVRPEGKLGKVEELREGGAQVAMVGDGINDASALAAADVGIAMGGGVQVRGRLSCCTPSRFASVWNDRTSQLASRLTA